MCENAIHNPIGVAGDDARYNLAGQKAIMILVSLPLQMVHKSSCSGSPCLWVQERLTLFSGWLRAESR